MQETGGRRTGEETQHSKTACLEARRSPTPIYGSDTAQANGLPFNPFDTCSPNSRTSKDDQAKQKPS